MCNSKIKILFDDGIEVTYDSLDELAMCSHIPRTMLRHLIAAKKKIPGVLCITVYQQQNNAFIDSNEIIQYDEIGNEIHRYKNANEARIETGISNIYKALDGSINTAGGFIWKYANESAAANTDKTKIILLSNNCEIIGQYNNIEDATNDTCVSEQDIENSMLHYTRTDAGFFIALNGINKEIIELDKNGFINSIYKKLNDACTNTGLSKNKICNSYSRGSYVGNTKYIRLETLLESIYNE